MKRRLQSCKPPLTLASRAFRVAQFLCPLAIFIGSPVQAANYYVGPSGSGCPFTSIETAAQQAAFTAEDDEIRVQNSVEHIVTTTIDIVANDPTISGELLIRGGFATCSSATPTDITIVRRTNTTGPVFEVKSTGVPTHVRFDRLTIRGGSVGIKVDGSGADADIDAVSIQETGIGVEVRNSGFADLSLAATISNNLALRGAGIYCEGGTVFSGAWIRNNTASISGGGIFAGSGCNFVLEEGSIVSTNQAGFGGGISTQSGGSLATSGSVTIRDNTATSNGGGIHVVDASVFLTDARVYDNSANRGGGVAARVNALMTMNASASCLSANPECSLLRGNSSDADGHAVFADSGAEVSLFRTHLASHRQNGGLAGEAVLASDKNTTVLLESVRYWDNHTASLFRSELDSSITAVFVSAAGNRWANEPPPGLPPLFFNSSGANASGGAGVDFYASVLANHGNFLTSMPSVVRGECVVAETVAGLTPLTIPQYQIVADPLFTDAVTGNLQLQPNSPALDFCDSFGYTPQSTDVRGAARNVDLPIANFIGTYDLGAYEFQLDELSIFEDGFESGDVSAWSAP